ncbi:TPA: TPM domain-containing protein, partial [Candidatus Gracilibacteria bacterium]|nr:TPM domain-containing protein [Candidatus Gracilibacteria bacterium]
MNLTTFAETKINLQNNNSERITDLANIFTPQEENNLKNKILEIEKNTQAQVAILTIQTLHDKKINPENLDIFQFGIELLSDKNLGWNIGDEKLDTGLFLL